MRRWRDCEGFWPNLIRWLCLRKVPWAMSYAARRVGEEIDDERTEQLLERVWRTGKTVIGRLNEAGEFIMTEHDLEVRGE